MKRSLPLALLLAVAGGLTGCRSTDLVFATYTKVGLHMTSEGSVPTSVQFGYKRFEGAVIPVDPTQATNGAAPMAPLYAGIAVTNGWLSGISIEQVFATGAAATNAATRGLLNPIHTEDAK
jgi:hypothetical protein